MIEFSYFLIMMVLLSGIIKGLVGFGFSMILIIVLLDLGISQTELMPILVPLFVALDILLYFENRKHIQIDYKINFALHSSTLMSLFIGILLGTYFLLELNVEFLKLFFAIFVLIILALLVSKVDKHQILVPDEKQNGLFGFVAGFMTGLFTLNGIVATIYLLYHQYPKEKYMATLVTFLLLSDIVLVGVYLFTGLFTISGFVLSLQILIIVLLGFGVGVYLRRLLPARLFKGVVITILALNSIKIIFDYFMFR